MHLETSTAHNLVNTALRPTENVFVAHSLKSNVLVY